MIKQKQPIASAFILFFVLEIFIASCGSKGTSDTANVEKKNSSRTSNDSTQTDSSGAKRFMAQISQLYVLYMEENEFKGLFPQVGGGASAPGGKLSFQFTLGNENSPLTLAVWPYQSNVYDGNKVKALRNDLMQWPLSIAEGDILGGLKLTNSDVKKILDYINQPPPASNTEVISFRPRRNLSRIIYEIDVYPSIEKLREAASSEKINVAAFNGIKLNPSPPAMDNPDAN